MSTGQLKVNKNCKIFLRKDRFVAGLLSGTQNFVPIGTPDLILIYLFTKKGNPNDVAQLLLNDDYRKYFPAAPPLQNILGRVQELYKQKILINSCVTTNSNENIEIFSLENLQISDIDTQQYYKLGNNFALNVDQNEYQTWSPLTQRFYTLSLEIILILSAFTSAKNFQQIKREIGRFVDTEKIPGAINWLHKIGLLKKTSSITATSSTSEQKPNVTDELFIKNDNSPNWENIEADGRIPIYFTPHMRNHYPLALGMISSFIETYKEGTLLKKYQLLPITFLEPQQFLDGPYKKFGPGIWMFSNYMWSLNLNMQMSKYVKADNANNLTIHGGPSTPNYVQASIDFMNKNPSIDISVHGEGELSAAEILASLERLESGKITYKKESMQHVPGITFRNPDNAEPPFVRTDKRDRMESPDTIPSPYLTGLFNSYNAKVDAAIIESNRGCPFGCTFCDWGSATNQKVRKFDLERVKHEIEWIGTSSVPVLWIADANFGMYNRDIELAKWICDIKEKYGYPREVVVNYTKNATKRLAEIIKAFTAGGIISQGIISIQTTDTKTLEVINRKNIKIDKYDELTKIFTEENLPLSTDLMIGLPGITVDAFDKDLQRYFDADVLAKAYPTQLLPNSPMADPEYIKKYDIKTNDNDLLISCYSYTEEDLKDMKAIYNTYVVADGYCALRYVLRYLQWEHKISALSFLQNLRKTITSDPDKYPTITWTIKRLLSELFIPGGWVNFYNEVAQFIFDQYKIKLDSALNTILYVNELVMPDNMKTYPLTVELEHDVVAYIQDHNTVSIEKVKPLNTYHSATFTVEDPDQISEINTDDMQYDSHQYFWELNSTISRIKSTSGANIVKKK